MHNNQLHCQECETGTQSDLLGDLEGLAGVIALSGGECHTGADDLSGVWCTSASGIQRADSPLRSDSFSRDCGVESVA